jgi:hypothetical protein
LKGTVVRIVGAMVLFALVAYAGDYVWVWYRVSKHLNPFATVTIQPYYAIHQKNGKTEYDFAPPESQLCVHSLFPHLGYSPCWYVKRHTEKRIDI